MAHSDLETSRRSRRVQSVDNAIDVLEALAEIGEAAGVSDLARRTGLSKTTVFHLLATLETRRLVMRSPDDPTYRLSWGLYELGSQVLRDADLSRAARPYLDRLVGQTRETALLGILDEDAVLYLDRGESPRGLRMRADAGRRGALHATASGKVLLAYAEPALVQRVLARPLERLTSTTITDASALRREIAEVRRNGYATCWQEREVGLCSFAVPLRNYTNQVVGSLALAGPATRVTSREVAKHLGPLQAAAHAIENRLGARPQPL